jgi:hypothetical protein
MHHLCWPLFGAFYLLLNISAVCVPVMFKRDDMGTDARLRYARANTTWDRYGRTR